MKRLAALLLCLLCVPLLGRPASAQGEPEHLRPVPVDRLLRSVATQQSGYRPYSPRTATMDGRAYPRSLVTEVNNNVDPNDQIATLTLRLDGRYRRFLAMVGRDDILHRAGPAYCYFEVWGDGRRLFRSEAIRSGLTQVLAGPSASKRKVPQEVDVPVRGVLSLRLVTRYAREFSQQAPNVNRASGCVWGSAQLLPLLPPTGRDLVPDDRLREAARAAALRLAAGVGGDAALQKRLPLTVGVPPLRREAGAPGEEAALRLLIAQEIFAVRRGLDSIFKALPTADAAALAAALPPTGSARTVPASVAAIGRGFQADLVLLGALTKAGGRWQVTLRLVETKAGKPLEVVTVPLPPAEKN